MRVPAIPHHGSIGIDMDEQDTPRSGFYSAVIPVASVACLSLWILAIWKAVDLIGGS